MSHWYCNLSTPHLVVSIDRWSYDLPLNEHGLWASRVDATSWVMNSESVAHVGGDTLAEMDLLDGLLRFGIAEGKREGKITDEQISRCHDRWSCRSYTLYATWHGRIESKIECPKAHNACGPKVLLHYPSSSISFATCQSVIKSFMYIAASSIWFQTGQTWMWARCMASLTKLAASPYLCLSKNGTDCFMSVVLF